MVSGRPPFGRSMAYPSGVRSWKRWPAAAGPEAGASQRANGTSEPGPRERQTDLAPSRLGRAESSSSPHETGLGGCGSPRRRAPSVGRPRVAAGLPKAPEATRARRRWDWRSRRGARPFWWKQRAGKWPSGSRHRARTGAPRPSPGAPPGGAPATRCGRLSAWAPASRAPPRSSPPPTPLIRRLGVAPLQARCAAPSERRGAPLWSKPQQPTSRIARREVASAPRR